MGKEYKPVRLDKNEIAFVNDFGKDDNFTRHLECIITNFEELLNQSRKELSITFSKDELLYFISIFEDAEISDITSVKNYKQFIISAIQESAMRTEFNTNYQVEVNELLNKIQCLTMFSCYSLIYNIIEYNKKYAEKDISNIYFNNYFSAV